MKRDWNKELISPYNGKAVMDYTKSRYFQIGHLQSRITSFAELCSQKVSLIGVGAVAVGNVIC